MTIACPCLEYERGVSPRDTLSVLEGIRHTCPALGTILIPDVTWTEFREFESRERDEALHASTLIIALAKGVLGKITIPIHRLLLDDHQPKHTLIRQYRVDLQERWMFADSAIERHRLSKSFQGKIIELQVAEWLESKKWTLDNLAALGAHADIECQTPLGFRVAIELKSIGQEEEEFQETVNSLAGRPAGGLYPDNSGYNYFLFRAYEAARQSRKSGSFRIGMIVLELGLLTAFVLPQLKRITPSTTLSFRQAGEKWDAFLGKKLKTYPTIQSDLDQTIKTLHKLWIVTRDDMYTYKCGHRISFDSKRLY
jgi:hypothetical protein